MVMQVVERMGKYLGTLEPGLRLLIPILDKVKYVQSLKGSQVFLVSKLISIRSCNGDSKSVGNHC